MNLDFTLLSLNVRPDEWAEAEGFVSTLEGLTKNAAADSAMSRKTALAADLIYQRAGLQNTVPGVMFRKMARGWNPAFSAFTDCVTRVLERDAMEKRATNPLALAGTAWGLGSKGLGRILLATAGVGAIGGGTYNAGKRYLQSDSKDNDRLEMQLQHYRKLTREIEEEMIRSGLSPEEATAKVKATFK